MLQATLPGQQIRQPIRMFERTFELDPQIDHAFGANRQLLAGGIALLEDRGERGEQRRSQSSGRSGTPRPRSGSALRGTGSARHRHARRAAQGRSPRNSQRAGRPSLALPSPRAPVCAVLLRQLPRRAAPVRPTQGACRQPMPAWREHSLAPSRPACAPATRSTSAAAPPRFRWHSAGCAAPRTAWTAWPLRCPRRPSRSRAGCPRRPPAPSLGIPTAPQTPRPRSNAAPCRRSSPAR